MPTEQNQLAQENHHIARQRRLSEVLKDANLPGLALNAGPSLTYLTGLHFHLSERPVLALFTVGQPLVLILPELESAKISRLPFPLRPFSYGEDPAGWGEVFAEGLQAAALTQETIGVESRQMRYLELELIQGPGHMVQFVRADRIVADLRMRKDENEIERMRKAVQIAQDALIAALNAFHIGMTERELAAELTVQILKHGSDSQFPFSPIVSGGPNSANPHATPGDRPFESGDLLVIDWGATHHGYVSDLTRTFAVGDVEPEFKQIALLVQIANEAGRQACKPDATAQEIDNAARRVIEDAGYGQYFFHRTGHGIGMEGHEEPYIHAGNTSVMAPGMAFTVEPGIYLPDRGGVRVEDNVVITPSGMESLSDLPRALLVLPFN